MNTHCDKCNMYIIVTDIEGNIRIYRFAQGSRYGPVKMILPEPEARVISISWSLP